MSSNGSKSSLERARSEVLAALAVNSLKARPLLSELRDRGVGAFDARAAIWDLMDRRQVRYTQDRRLTLESSKNRNALIR
jgi:hypothetical protein